MADPNGNLLKWFKTGYADMEETHTYVLKGTVKAHEVYTNKAGINENQTLITRCKVVSEVEATTPDAAVMNVFA